MAAETAAQRVGRERQRTLFDRVAEQYDATRQSYPAEVVDAILTTSAVAPGAAGSKSAAAQASSPGNWPAGGLTWPPSISAPRWSRPPGATSPTRQSGSR